MSRIPCPLCGADERTLVARYAGMWNFRVRNVVCRRCGLGYRSEPWSQEQVKAFYPTVSRYYQQVFGANRLAGSCLDQQREQAEPRADFVRERLHPGARLLDVGAGNGNFVEAARARGLVAEGIELDEDAVQRASASGIPVTLAAFEDVALPPESLDALTMFDVLEHSADPRAFLQTASRLLKPGGLLIIDVPDALHTTVKLEYYLVPEHNWHFTSGTLRYLLTQNGWEMREMETVAVPYNIARAVRAVAVKVPAGEVRAIPTGPDEHDAVVASFRKLRRETRLPLPLRILNACTLVFGPRVGAAVYRGLAALRRSLKRRS
jgi:2-polyprenyl-3-methyl-5-hydroxy-6-metoxy-1,4-benzoquinol methylase